MLPAQWGDAALRAMEGRFFGHRDPARTAIGDITAGQLIDGIGFTLDGSSAVTAFRGTVRDCATAIPAELVTRCNFRVL